MCCRTVAYVRYSNTNPELDCPDCGRREGILGLAPDKQQEHKDTNQRCNEVATRGGG